MTGRQRVKHVKMSAPEQARPRPRCRCTLPAGDVPGNVLGHGRGKRPAVSGRLPGQSLLPGQVLGQDLVGPWMGGPKTKVWVTFNHFSAPIWRWSGCHNSPQRLEAVAKPNRALLPEAAALPRYHLLCFSVCFVLWLISSPASCKLSHIMIVAACGEAGWVAG